MKHLIFSILFIAIAIQLRSQTPNVRGMYVDGFSTILGNTVKEDSLLKFAKSNNFNYLALYDLPNSINTSTKLENFILKAKQNYGILQIGAIAETYSYFGKYVTVYNKKHTNPLQRIDVYNVEFEYWNVKSSKTNYWCSTYLKPNGYTCDTAGSFKYYLKMIQKVDSLAHADNVKSEIYLGWFSQSQAIKMANSVDRILLHDYISNYANLYSYVSTRLQYIAARQKPTEVILLLSAETSFLGPWLATHPLAQPYNDMIAKLNSLNNNWKQYINLNGYQWFAYTDIVKATKLTVTASAGITKALIQDSALVSETTPVYKVYPNPNNGEFTINQDNDKATFVDVYNNLGELIYTSQITGVNTEIVLNNQPKGIYFYQIKNGSQVLNSGKIVVE